MEVIVILVVISLGLVVAAILLLLSRVHAGDLEHGDRLSLLPLEAEDTAPAPSRHRTGPPPGERS